MARPTVSAFRLLNIETAVAEHYPVKTRRRRAPGGRFNGVAIFIVVVDSSLKINHDLT